MSKLPLISGDRAIKIFSKLVTIPRHKVLGKGLLRKLLRDADISVEDFLQL